MTSVQLLSISKHIQIIKHLIVKLLIVKNKVLRIILTVMICLTIATALIDIQK